jgi:cardiolipin synthase (CMP-forming)
MNANEEVGKELRPAKDDARSNRLWTIPNVICILRFFGSLLLIPIAYAGNEKLFVITVLLLFASDWIDGKLAIWLNQRSVLGARIDSVADSTFYVMTGLGALWLKWSEFGAVFWWCAAAVGSYAMTIGAALWKYGKMPSYHTYGAKISNWLVMVGMAIWFMWDQVWPLRLALVGVVLTNLETTLMTWKLPEWRADVPTLWHARRFFSTKAQRREERAQPRMDANSR